MVIFGNEVDIFLTANASMKPKDQQRLKKTKKIMPYNLTYNFKWLFVGIKRECGHLAEVIYLGKKLVTPVRTGLLRCSRVFSK